MKEHNIEKLYNTLFEHYYPNLLFYATRFLDEVDAEDVVLDVFTDLWRRRNEVDMGEQIQSFLYRAVYTRSINLIKHRQIVADYSDEAYAFYMRKVEFYADELNEVWNRLENLELGHAIEQAISELPQKTREVFRMSYYFDMKNKDIAEKQGISIRTVEAHMYKALRYLRGQLEHWNVSFSLLMVLFRETFLT